MPNLYYIGDSTVQYNDITTWPQCGMGQQLGLYLLPEVTVSNHAVNGRSTKSFWDEGRFEPVQAALQPGDVLLIQFGHNDEKIQDPTRYATPEQYAANLLRYAQLARAKGALPVPVTPLVRRKFENGTLCPTHGKYPAAMCSLAAAERLPLIDLTAASAKLVQAMGDKASAELYMHLEPGHCPNYPEGLADDTHLRYAGAVAFAGLVADGLATLGEPYSGFCLPGALKADRYRANGSV